MLAIASLNITRCTGLRSRAADVALAHVLEAPADLRAPGRHILTREQRQTMSRTFAARGVLSGIALLCPPQVRIVIIQLKCLDRVPTGEIVRT